MKILDYFKSKRDIMVLDYDFVIHFVTISDMYRWLIDNHKLDYAIINIEDGKEKKTNFTMTFEDWFKEKTICTIDLITYFNQKQNDNKPNS